MDVIDEYKTVSKASEGLYKDRGSKFFAYLFPVKNEEEVNSFLAEVKVAHPKARHHCYAFRLLPDGSLFRANDDGEPSGSAGKPILNALLSAELTNSLVIVVRYFGGTLLGVSGLINAYKSAAEEAISFSEQISLTVDQTYEVYYGFEDMHNVMRIMKDLELTILGQDYKEANILTFSARLSLASSISEAFVDLYKVELKKI
jgi:uncharacterized YigZ family protein